MPLQHTPPQIVRDSVPSVDPSAVRTSRSWEWICSALVNKEKGECVVDILDTVFVQRDQVWSWYYSSSGGIIRKKAQRKLTVPTVYQHFLKIARAYEQNEANYVAVCWFEDQRRMQLLTAAELQPFLSNCRGNMCLSTFAHPRGELDPARYANLQHEYSLNKTGRVQGKLYRLAMGNQRIMSMDNKLNNAVTEAVQGVVSFVERAKKCRVVQCVSYLILDDFGRSTLWRIDDCLTIPGPLGNGTGEGSGATSYDGPHAVNERLLVRARADAKKKPDEKLIQAILASPTPSSKRQTLLLNASASHPVLPSQSTQFNTLNPHSKRGFITDMKNQLRTKSDWEQAMKFLPPSSSLSRDRKRTLSAAHLMSSQKRGCCGDYCGLDIRKFTTKRLSSAANLILGNDILSPDPTGRMHGGRSSSIVAATMAASAFLSSHPDHTIDDQLTRKPMSPQRQQMQGSKSDITERPHAIPFKLIAQTRAEKQLVDLFIRRYQKGEDGDYLAEVYYGEGEPLGQTFPGYYYQEVQVCAHCFAFYTLIEDVRMKALSRIARRRNSRKDDREKDGNCRSRPRALVSLREECDNEGDDRDTERRALDCAKRVATGALTHAQSVLAKSLSKKDAAELFSYVNPHPAVVMVISALGALLFGRESVGSNDLKRLTSQDTLLVQVQSFDIKNVTPKSVEIVAAYARNALFTPTHIAPISSCAALLCDWILTILQAYAWSHPFDFRQDQETWERLAYFKSDLCSHVPRHLIHEMIFQSSFLRDDVVDSKRSVDAQMTSIKKISSNTTKAARKAIQQQQMARLAAPPGNGEKKSANGGEFTFTCEDGFTQIPYTVCGQAVAASTKCNLIVFNDFFDTMESTKVFFRPILSKHVGARALFFNLPGQAGTKYPISDAEDNRVVFNNTWYSHRVHELLAHLQATGAFITRGLPFHIVGFGNGANIAACFAVLYGQNEAYESDLQGCVLLNGFARVDSQLAAILHSSVNVFSCFPPARPDLPVTFFCKYLFSDEYLSKIDINLALSIYTAVTNPITLDGRVRICKGALHHVNLTPRLAQIRVPLILIQSIENALVVPTSVDPFLQQRVNVSHSWSHQQQGSTTGPSSVSESMTSKTKKQLYQALGTPGGAFVSWLRAGHELRQEAKHYITELFEAIVCSKEVRTRDSHEHVTAEPAQKKHSIIQRPQVNEESPEEDKSSFTGVELCETGAHIIEASSDVVVNMVCPSEPFRSRRIDSIVDEVPSALVTPSTKEGVMLQESIPDTLPPQPSVVQECIHVPVMDQIVVTSTPGRPSIPTPVIQSTSAYPMVEEVAIQLPDLSHMDAAVEAVRSKMDADERRLAKEAEELRERQRRAAEERIEALRQEQERRRRQWEEEDNARLAALEKKLREEQEARDMERKRREHELLLADLAVLEDANHIVTPKQKEAAVLHADQSRLRSADSLISSELYEMKLQIQRQPQLPSIFDQMEAEEKAKRRIGTLRVDDYEDVKRSMTQNFNHHVKEHNSTLREELLRRKHSHAIRIQKLIRRFLAVQRVSKLRHERQHARIRQFAGSEIVRIVRGFLGRRRFVRHKERRNREIQEKSSAISIQRLFRGFLCRVKFRRLLRNKRAQLIQRVYRGHRGRMYCAELRESQIRRRFLDRNASKLQAAWRMHVERERFVTHRISILAATEIQRLYRGHLGRVEARRKKAWCNAEPGPERLALGLKMIEGSKQAFERQQNEIDALHRAQEAVERQVSTIHTELQESEKELAVLERELQEIDQLEADLRELTHEAEMLHSGGLEGVLRNNTGAVTGTQASPQPLGNGVPKDPSQRSSGLPGYEVGMEELFESRGEMKKRQAGTYAVEMAIQIKRAEREKKKKDLEAEFTSVFAEVQMKRQALAVMEEKLADMEATRMRKDREFARMQRNLMELLEEQKLELENLREKGIELETATATSAAAAAATAMKAKEHEKRSQAMFESTEELMKFQFMSMSLSYFSSLNMLKSLRDINADTTAAAISSTAETAAAAAAAAAAANIPTMKRLQVGGSDLMMTASQLKKHELEKKLKEEEDAKHTNRQPLPDQVKDWNVDDVGRWLDSLSLAQYKQAFQEGAVDGEFLLELRPEDMSDVLGVSHKLHVRKIIVARNKLLPISQQEQLQIDAVEHEQQARNTRVGGSNSSSPAGSVDVDIVFSQARNGRLKRLVESVDAGFDINSEDDKGNNLLLIACQNVNMKMVEYLVAKRANVNHKNAQGNTPLHFAMAYDSEGKLGEYLIAHGADDTIENVYGLTAYDGLQPE